MAEEKCTKFLKGSKESVCCGLITIYHIDKGERQSPARQPQIIRRRSYSRELTPDRQLNQTKKSIYSILLKGSVLNGLIFMMSILLFEYVIMPFIHNLLKYTLAEDNTREVVWVYLSPALTFIFKSVWIAPIFLFCKFVNSVWYQDIADSVYRHTKGRPCVFRSWSVTIADVVFSFFVETLIMFQSTLVEYIIPVPILGSALSLFLMAMLYSLYCFEYKWYNMGWDLHRRLTFIEANWPYFLGFGLPLVICTHCTSSSLIGACIFAVVFPYFLLSAYTADPESSPCACHFPFFSPAIYVTNVLFKMFFGEPQPRTIPQQPNTPSRNSRSSTPSTYRGSTPSGFRGNTAPNFRASTPLSFRGSTPSGYSVSNHSYRR